MEDWEREDREKEEKETSKAIWLMLVFIGMLLLILPIETFAEKGKMLSWTKFYGGVVLVAVIFLLIVSASIRRKL